MISEQASDFVKSWLKYVGLPFHIELYQRAEHARTIAFNLFKDIELSLHSEKSSPIDSIKDLFFEVQEGVLASEWMRQELEGRINPLHAEIAKLTADLEFAKSEIHKLQKFKNYVDVQFVLTHGKAPEIL
jgi:hypothetical protein